jgi:mRNA interferase MazF
VVLSPRAYNARTSLALVVPVTSQRKDYPFEVALPDGLPVAGYVLADQVRSLDWRARRVRPIGPLPAEALAGILGVARRLLE